MTTRFVRDRRLAALLLLYLLAAGCAAARTRADAEALRVVVFNIHAGKDATGEHNLARVAALVRELAADLVLLQEVDRRTARSSGEDQLAALAELTGMHAAFGRTLDLQGGAYGLGILSRWPILSDSLHLFPVHHPTPDAAREYEPRGALHVEVAAHFGTLHILNTHLTHTPEDGYRLQEVATLRALADLLRRTGRPVLVGGDFNAPPGGAVIERMTVGGWRDAWPGCGGGPGFNFPVDAPDRRIDYLFIAPDLTCDSAAVIESRASDHRPVLFLVRVGMIARPSRASQSSSLSRRATTGRTGRRAHHLFGGDACREHAPSVGYPRRCSERGLRPTYSASKPVRGMRTADSIVQQRSRTV